jgi:hypothetical protein
MVLGTLMIRVGTRVGMMTIRVRKAQGQMFSE